MTGWTQCFRQRPALIEPLPECLILNPTRLCRRHKRDATAAIHHVAERYTAFGFVQHPAAICRTPRALGVRPNQAVLWIWSAADISQKRGKAPPTGCRPATTDSRPRAIANVLPCRVLCRSSLLPPSPMRKLQFGDCLDPYAAAATGDTGLQPIVPNFHLPSADTCTNPSTARNSPAPNIRLAFSYYTESAKGLVDEHAGRAVYAG